MLDLFDLAETMARRTDPVTSHLGAASIVESLGDVQTWVLGLLRQHPGTTSSELAQACGVGDIRKINRRLPELERLGKVRRGEMRKCNITGRMAQPWYPVELA